MKKFISKTGFSVLALLPVLLLSAPVQPVQAQDSEPVIYKCRHCVKYTGWRGVVDFGIGYVDTDSYRFGDYRGLEKEGVYAAIDGDIHYRDLQGRYLDLYATNLGYDSREFDLRGGNQGSFELRFGWQEIPKYRGYGTQTPFLGVGGKNLTLPEDWVYANTTGLMDALESSLAIAPLKTRRQILDAGWSFNIASNWSFRIDYQNQSKKGTRTLGAGMFYTNGTILPAPVDFSTDLVDMDVTWANRRAQLKLGFISSHFSGFNSSLKWENPFRSRPEHSIFRAGLEPDNKSYQVNLSGAYAFTPQIRLSGNAAIGSMSQNDPFLPYSTNPQYSDVPLPRSSLNGKVDASTYNLAGKLYTRINHKLSFTARGKWDERDNKTPVEIYTPVTTDLLVMGPRYNRPYSYERQQYSADLRYRANRVVRLSGGARRVNTERTLQAVEETEETTWWGEVKVNPGFNSEVRFKLESADRDVGDYLQPEDGGPVDHPLMRKFNMADREADRMLIEVDFMLTEKFGVNLGYIQSDAEYDNSELGLQNSDEEIFTVDLNYAINQKMNLYAFYNLNYIDANILHATSNNATPWEAETNDRMETFGIGLSATISEKSSIGFDYVSSDSEGDISVQTTREEDPFDTLLTDLTNLKLYFDYKYNDSWGYTFYAEQEKYEAADWAIDGLGVDGINSVLTMGEESPKYDVWYIRFQLRYRF